MSNSTLLKNIISYIVNHPLKVMLLGLVGVLLITAGAHKLRPNFSYRIWFNPDNPKLTEFDAFERRFGSDEIAVVVLHSPDGIFDKASIETAQKITADLWLAPEVIRVDSLTNFNWVHAEGDDILVEPLVSEENELTPEYLEKVKTLALTHNTIPGYLVNKKADVTLFMVNLKPSIDGTPDYDAVVSGLRDIMKKYEGQYDHTLYLTGTPTLNHAFKESSQADMANLVPLVILMVILFLVFNFKRFSGVAISLAIVFLTILVTVGNAGWIGLEINTLTGVVPQFMIAISLAVVVHLLVNFFRFYSSGMEKKEAISLALEKNFRPTLLTSLSTAIGFFSYTTSGIPPIGQMGLMAGVGTLLSWVVSYVFVAPIIMIAPIKQKKKNLASVNESTEKSKKITDLIFKFRYLIFATAGIISLTAVFLASKVEVNSDPFNYFDKHYPLSIANHFVEDNVGGAVGSEIVIDSGSPEGIKDPEFLKKVEEFQNWLDTFPFVTKTISVVNILKEMNQSLNGGSKDQYKLPETRDAIAQQLFLYSMNLPQGMDINNRVTIENDSIRLTAMWTIHESKLVLKYIDQFEAKAKELGLSAHVTGKMPLYQSNNQLVVDSFIVSISIALLLVGILLCYGLNSIKLGMLSILPNAFPLIVGAGVLQIMGQSLDIGTVIVASVCLGIAVDDTIHFLSAFKMYKDQGLPNREAVARIFTHTAPALVTTTMVLVAAFATFTFASFVPNQNFGEMVAIILTIALIADLTFLPALVLTINMWDKTSSTTKS